MSKFTFIKSGNKSRMNTKIIVKTMDYTLLLLSYIKVVCKKIDLW